MSDLYRTPPEQAPWPRLGVYKVGQGVWLAPSSTVDGQYYRVSQHHTPKDGGWFECACKAGRDRGKMMVPRHEPTCRHVRLVAEAERADGVPPRPSGTFKPAMFVD